MKVPLVDLKVQYLSIRKEINDAIQRVLNHGGYILGEEVRKFEEHFAHYVNVSGAVGVASGTAALHLSLLACGVGPGDEVITTGMTFFATGEAISVCGARPVFVDVDPDTLLINTAQVEQAISSRTKAIVPVHLYGQAAEMNLLRQLCDRFSLWLIEDAAQAHGAEFAGKRCGSLGDLGCFSFFPGKNLGAYGDGGMVTGNNIELLNKVRILRNHGRREKYEHEEIGWGYRLDALQAAVLDVKLAHLDKWTDKRAEVAAQYTQLLQDTELEPLLSLPDRRHAFHLYVVRSAKRERILQHLHRKGVGAGIHYPVPMHRQPAYLKQGYESVNLPVCEHASNEILSLPIFPEMSAEQVAYVVDAVKEALT